MRHVVQEAGITLVYFNDTYLLDLMGDGTFAGLWELCMISLFPRRAECALRLCSLLSSR